MWRCTCVIASFSVLFLGKSAGIIMSNEEQPKPTYTAGIKTTHWKNLNTIQTHHNYSKVHINNDNNPIGHSQYVISQTERTQKIYPVYNAHSYGGNQRPQGRDTNSQSGHGHFASLVSRNSSTGLPETNRTIYKRKIHYKTVDVYEKCPESATGQFVYSLNCNQFLNCWKGRGQPQNCSPGTLFNPKTLECDYPDKVECITGPRENTLEGIRFQKSTTQALCPKEFTGLIPNYTDCSKFINCNNGQHYSLDCPPGTLFDVNRNVCDFPSKSTCFDGSQNGSEETFNHGQHGSHHYGSAIQGQHGSHHYDSQRQGQPYGSAIQGQRGSGHYEATSQDGSRHHQLQGQHGIDAKLDFGQDQTASGNSHIDSQTRCGPDSQICRNAFGQNVYHRTTNCDPQVENCGNTQTSFSYSQGQRCDPQTQNCGQTTRQTTNQGCNEYNDYCGQGSYRTTSPQGQGHVSGSAQTNYNRVCNINDPNCHRTGNANSKEPKCPVDYQGLMRHPTDCAKFLNCANGQTFVQACAPGTLFSPTLGVCDFPYKVHCANTEEEIATTGSPQTEAAPNQGHDTRYQGQGGYSQGHWSSSQGQNRYNQGQGGYSDGTLSQGQNNYSGGQSGYSQRPVTYSQGQGNYEQTTDGYNRGYDGQESIYSQSHGSRPLTPRPGHYVTILSGQRQGTVRDVDRGQIGVVNRPNGRLEDLNIDKKANKFPDYDDVVDANAHGFHATSPRSVWPPPFPSTDVNADYVFEYEDGEPVTLSPENVFFSDKEKKTICDSRDFYCTRRSCVSNTLVCDGHRDCENGKDEKYCDEHLERFAARKNHRLDVLEKQRWINVSYTTCAYLCIESHQFNCRSFNYRRNNRVCYLSDSNVGLSGALRIDDLYDYYELTRTSINCTGDNYYKCQNDKCITRGEVCDGVDDCGNRQDERGCKPEDFGYSIALAGSTDDNEGRVEIRAFGRKGYICDDKFGILDANVVCRELGFPLGAAEFKGNSYYAKDIKETKTAYLMDDLDCFGNETTLLDCGFAGWGVHNCRDGEIAGVTCKTPQDKCGTGYWKCDVANECVPISFVCDGLYDCTDNSDEGSQHCEAPIEMRLANGTSNKEGRIEIKHHGIWGTICDDDFNEDAGKVACKYFGFKGAAVVKKDAYFGRGEGPIWLDQVSCYGNETELNKCTHWNWGEHNCDHGEDVGVICSNDYDVVAIQRHSKVSDGHHTTTRPSPISCGFRKDNQFLENDLIHARVVSGSVAKRGDYPWQAALRVKGKGKAVHWCGAVVISGQWVLTAAHCLQGYAKGAYIVVAGEYNTDEDEGTEQEKYIEEYFIHEDFRKGHKMNNDIALIKLKDRGFVLNDDVQPICLPDSDSDYERELNCTVSGFGSVKSGTSAYSHDMRSAWIPIHNAETCSMPHVYGTAITEGMICAGFLDGGVDACDGDSGGPLACLENGLFTLYGVTSWGQHCGYANKPGVYVKVGHYRKWIDDVISRHS